MLAERAISVDTHAMPPKPGYVPPSRLNKSQILLHLDNDLRVAFKVACTENGETMQAVLTAYIEEYSAATRKRLKAKAAREADRETE